MTQKTKAYVALGAVCFLWGTTYLAMRTGVQHMPGLMLAGIRQTICGVIVVGVYLLRRYPIPDLGMMVRLAVVGALLLGAGNGLMSWGEQTVPSGLASVLGALNPMCMALFSLWLIRGTQLSPRALTGLFLGLAGIVFIFYPLLVAPGQRAFGFGALLILLSVLGWSSGSVYAAKQHFDLPLLYACGWQFLWGGLILIVVSWASGHTIPLSAVRVESWFSIAYLVVFGSLLGYSAFQYALRHLPTTQVAIYGYVNPLVALLLGWAILHEVLSWRLLAGTLVTLCGVYLVQRSYQKVRLSQGLVNWARKYRKRTTSRPPAGS